MTVKIHHASQKLAAKHGLTLTVVENDVACIQLATGRTLASAPTGKQALDRALTKLNGQAAVAAAKPASTLRDRLKSTVAKLTGKKKPARPADEEDDESKDLGDEDLGDGADDAEDEADGPLKGWAALRKKYRPLYLPHNQTCGDPLSGRISEYVRVQEKVKNRAGKTVTMEVVSAARIERIARANGCWDDRYAALNNGQKRMNVGNRLRKLERDGIELVWPK